MKSRLVEIGKIFTTFGLKGCVKVYPYSDAQIFESFKGKAIWIDDEQAHIEVKMKDVKPANKKNYLVELEGFDTIEKSKRIVGKTICIEEKELPPVRNDEYYFFQVIGMEVYDESNNLIGVVEDVIQTGANDVFVVESNAFREKAQIISLKNFDSRHQSQSEEILIPSVKDYVLKMDLKNSRMTVRRMEWY